MPPGRQIASTVVSIRDLRLAVAQAQAAPIVVSPAIFDDSHPEYAKGLFVHLSAQRDIYAQYFRPNDEIKTAGSHYRFPQACLYQKTEQSRTASFHFIKGRLGQGGYGEVFNTDSYTISSDDTNESIHCSKNPRPLALKAQRTRPGERNIEVMINKEHQLSTRLPHLNVQPLASIDGSLEDPRRRGKTALFVMNKMEGEELFGMLYPEGGKANFTFDFRMQLTKALLDAVKTQVSDHGLVHFDLKPENIIVNRNPMEVNIIDYGLADELNSYCRTRGTIPYLPQEAWDTRARSSKVDVFSTGRILVEIWGGRDKSYDLLEIHKQATYTEYLRKGHILKNLFNDLEPGVRTELVQAGLVREIKSLLSNMLDYNPLERCSIDVARAQFLRVYNDYEQHKLNGQPAVAAAVNPQTTAHQATQKSPSPWRNRLLTAGLLIGAGVGLGLVLTGVFAPFGLATWGIVGAVAASTSSATLFGGIIGKFIDYVRQKSSSTSRVSEPLSTSREAEILDTSGSAKALAGLAGPTTPAQYIREQQQPQVTQKPAKKAAGITEVRSLTAAKNDDFVDVPLSGATTSTMDTAVDATVIRTWGNG